MSPIPLAQFPEESMEISPVAYAEQSPFIFPDDSMEDSRISSVVSPDKSMEVSLTTEITPIQYNFFPKSSVRAIDSSNCVFGAQLQNVSNLQCAVGSEIFPLISNSKKDGKGIKLKSFIIEICPFNLEEAKLVRVRPNNLIECHDFDENVISSPVGNILEFSNASNVEASMTLSSRDSLSNIRHKSILKNTQEEAIFKKI